MLYVQLPNLKTQTHLQLHKEKTQNGGKMQIDKKKGGVREKSRWFGTGSGARLVNEKKASMHEPSCGLNLRNDTANSLAQGSRLF